MEPELQEVGVPPEVQDSYISPENIKNTSLDKGILHVLFVCLLFVLFLGPTLQHMEGSFQVGVKLEL